jgi:hypothetical protein
MGDYIKKIESVKKKKKKKKKKFFFFKKKKNFTKKKKKKKKKHTLFCIKYTNLFIMQQIWKQYKLKKLTLRIV